MNPEVLPPSGRVLAARNAVSMPVRITVVDCKRVAAERGGECLSRRYANARAKLRWRCAEGHRWKSAWDTVRSGRWCPTCARRSPYAIEDMRAVATDRGGDCLSKEHVNSYSKLHWRCAKWHTWKATPKHVLAGSWCPRCAKHAPWTLDRLMLEARRRGGDCLGPATERGRYRWRCGLRHEWSATSSSVAIEGTWCPVCAGCKPLSLEDLRQTARERGGKCLARKYLGSQIKVEWRCKEGHRWEARPSAVRAGAWCPACAIERRRRPRPVVDIDDMRKLARERNGKCVSSIYVNAHKKLEWQCSQGHRWLALPGSIRQGRWCARCAGVASFTIDDMQILAAKHGGWCLSPQYLGTHEKLQWQCARRHVFWSSPAAVKRAASFCPECRPVKQGTLAEMRSIAAARGGDCRSSRYINAHTPLQWSCREGHRWRAAPHSIKSGSWCPLCARRLIRQTLIERLASL
jgi:hypothetical protein